jgi:hypothetical protein
MKKLILISILLLIFTNSFADAYTDLGEAAFQGFIGAFALAVLFSSVYMITSLLIPKSVSTLKKLTSTLKKTKRNIENIAKTPEDRILEIDDTYYEQALKEVEENTKNQGLWIKAGIITNDSLPMQKTEYIKLRAKQLSEENPK